MQRLVLDFLITVQFFLQLFIATILFSKKINKRENFCIRTLIFTVGIVCTGTIAHYVLWNTSIWILYNTMYYLLMFFFCTFYLYLIYDISYINALNAVITGYLVQNFSSQIFQLMESRSMSAIFPENDYLADIGIFQLFSEFFSTFPIKALIFLLMYLVFKPGENQVDYTKETRNRLMYISLFSLVVVVFISSYRDYYASESFSLMISSRLLSMMCCLLLIIVRVGVLELNSKDKESMMLRRIRDEEKKQYEWKKETIDRINIKCHDMRRQIELMEKKNGVVSVDELEQVKNLINIYDASINTGNHILDVILSEKSMYCEEKGIVFSCIIDGKVLGFMSEGDICSLFGNALDNAIRAVEELGGEDDKAITVKVVKRAGMAFISIGNTYRGTLVFDGKLPVTTKGNDGYHGFGLKSIQMTAEKYGGVISIDAEGIFVLKILIPCGAELP